MTLMIATLLAACAVATLANQPVPKEKIALSVQAWTFNKFTLFEAIQKTAGAGASYIEMFPGQTLKAGSDVKVGPEMGDEATAELLSFLAANKVAPIAFGVTGISKDPAEARKLFAWAKKMRLWVINTESTDALDTIEAMIKEFDIKVGIHNHPRRKDDPNYKVWDPEYVYSIVKDRDKRLGSCADTGHWVRSGIKPVDAIKALHGRIVGSHLKDLHVFEPGGHDVPYGTGVSDVPAILDAYLKMGFRGPVSVEYEYNWDTSLPEVAQCIGFARGYLRQ